MQVTMSYLEIYNENIRDLLDPSTGYLELRDESRGKNIQVKHFLMIHILLTYTSYLRINKGCSYSWYHSKKLIYVWESNFAGSVFLFIGSRLFVHWIQTTLKSLLSSLNSIGHNAFSQCFPQCFLLRFFPMFSTKVFPLKILSISNVSLPCFMVRLFVNWIQTFCSFNTDNFVKSWLSSLNSIGH